MKKIIFSFVVILISLLVITQQVKAEETNAIITKVNEIQKINGKMYKFKDSFIEDIQNYFVEYTLSDTDINYIADNIDEIIEVYKAASVDKWINLPEEERTKVTRFFNDINEKTAVNLSYSENGVLTVYNNKNEELFKASNFLIEVEKEEVKEEPSTTGNDSNMFIIVGGVAFAILLIVTRGVVRDR